MTGLRVTNILKKIKFGQIWGELESSQLFQRQSIAKYVRLTEVFIRANALWIKVVFHFSSVFR